MAGHLGNYYKQRPDFCNHCHDLRHAMTAKCLCMVREKACEVPWCPASADEEEFVSPPVPTFQKAE